MPTCASIAGRSRTKLRSAARRRARRRDAALGESPEEAVQAVCGARAGDPQDPGPVVGRVDAVVAASLEDERQAGAAAACGEDAGAGDAPREAPLLVEDDSAAGVRLPRAEVGAELDATRGDPKDQRAGAGAPVAEHERPLPAGTGQRHRVAGRGL